MEMYCIVEMARLRSIDADWKGVTMTREVREVSLRDKQTTALIKRYLQNTRKSCASLTIISLCHSWEAQQRLLWLVSLGENNSFDGLVERWYNYANFAVAWLQPGEPLDLHQQSSSNYDSFCCVYLFIFGAIRWVLGHKNSAVNYRQIGENLEFTSF